MQFYACVVDEQTEEAVELSIRVEDAQRFLAEVRADDRSLRRSFASSLLSSRRDRTTVSRW